MTERQQKMFTMWMVGLTSAIVGAEIQNYRWKRLFNRYNDATKSRLALVGGAYREITDVMENELLSGEEREEIIQTKVDFVEMIIQQDIL